MVDRQAISLSSSCIHMKILPIHQNTRRGLQKTH